ncbi:MAG: signal peptidase II [Deltaproteobacteria bacterium]|nr:signal peptidase II [Deltaproteobacteria bacterium]
MSFKCKALFIIAPAVFILDQLTKYLINSRIGMGESIAVMPDFFDIVHYANSGAAFGMFSGVNSSWRAPFFYAVSALALIAIIFYIVKMSDSERIMAAALSFVVGGILGNGMDRIRFGAVTDFLSFHIADKKLFGYDLVWPAFNVADSAITIAMFLIIIDSLRKKKQ